MEKDNKVKPQKNAVKHQKANQPFAKPQVKKKKKAEAKTKQVSWPQREKGIRPGVDPELPLTRDLYVPNQLTTLNWCVQIDDYSVNQVITGMVARVCYMGYGSGNTQNLPYLLASFLKRLIYSLVTQGVMPTLRGPKFLHVLCQLLFPTVVKWKRGHISYSWNTSVLTQDFPVSAFGLLDFHQSGSEGVNTFGFPVLLSSTAAYTEEAGLLAYQTFVAFCSQIQDNSSMLVVESLAETLPVWHDDASVFSSSQTNLTQAWGRGGQDLLLTNPKKITCPITSVFVDKNDTLGRRQTSIETCVYSTTCRYFANRLMTFQDSYKLKSKYRSIFKPIDVNDLYDLTAAIVGRAFERLGEFAGSNGINFQSCPLSGGEVFILIRTLCSIMSGGTMATDYLGPQSAPERFYPMNYSPAQENVTNTMSTMNLPTFVIENLRDLCMLSVDIEKKYNNPKYKNQCMLWVPVFGTYQRDRRQYNYTIVFRGQTFDLFGPGENAGDFEQDTLISTGTSDVICPTGKPLATAVQIWNDWLSPVASCVQLTNFTPDKPERTAGLLTYSRYFTPADTNPGSLRNRSIQNSNIVVQDGKEFIRVPVARTRSKTKESEFKLVPTYKTRLDVAPKVAPSGGTLEIPELALTANNRIESGTYDLLSSMVLPRFCVYDEPNENQLQIEALKLVTYEPYIILNSRISYSDVETITLRQRWAMAANNLTVPGTGLDSNIWVKRLEEFYKRGEGSWLGTLVGQLAAEATGLPFMASLGSALPF